MLKRAFALSDQGAKDLAKGIIATACANLIQIIPASLLLMVVMMLLEKAAGTLPKSTRHFPACSHNFPKAGEARFQGLSRLFRLLGKFPYLGESRRILMAVSSKTSSKTRFCYAATRRISSAAVQPSIWA